MSRRSTSRDRQAEIIEVTLHLLKDTPLASLTTRQIAKQLDLSQPALFRHFRSREKLLLAVMEKARSDLSALADSVLAAEQDPALRLTNLASALLDHVQAHPGLARLLFSPPEAGPMRDLLRSLVSMQRSLISQLVRDGQNLGVFRPELEPTDAAMYFVGMIQAIVLRSQLDEHDRPLAQEATPMMALWLQGTSTAQGAVQEPKKQREVSPSTNLFVLDVRPILSRGTDPLDEILAALATIRSAGVLTVTAPFRPTPLLRLLTERGHHVIPRQIDSKLWSVDVVVDGACSIDDLLDREAPEPLECVLEAVTSLASGQIYIARLPRFPRLLLPHLSEQAVDFEITEAVDDTALLHVRGRNS